MPLVSDIQTRDWSLSVGAPGEIVTDLNDISQCIFLILMTKKGSDPLRPEFGCDIFQYIDYPANIAAPLMAKAIKDAVDIYETRAILKTINATVNVSQLYFELIWTSSSSNGVTRINFLEKNPFDSTSQTKEYNYEYSFEYN